MAQNILLFTETEVFEDDPRELKMKGKFICCILFCSVLLKCLSVNEKKISSESKASAKKVESEYSVRQMPMYVLGTFKVGQNFSIVNEQLGKPSKIHTFPDKFEAHIYQYKGFQLIFEKSPSNPDRIYAVQLTGNECPEETCLDKICLSSSKEDVLKILGTPSTVKDAVDEVTGKNVSATQYYSYRDTGNFSLELSGGKVTSIKITDTLTPAARDADVYGFIGAVKNKDYYKMAQHLDPLFEGSIERKAVPLKKSLIKFLKDKNKMTDLLFGSEHGFADLTAKDQQFEGLRLFNDGRRGKVFKFKSAKGKTIEFVYNMSHQGWNIWEINLY